LKITSIEQGHRGGCKLEYWKGSADGGAVAQTVSVFDSPQTATVYDVDHPKTKGKHCTIDLDTGLTKGLPYEQLEASSKDIMSYLAWEGVDAVGEFASNEAGLIALGMVFEAMPAQAWDRLTPAELTARLSGRTIAATKTTIMQWNSQGDQSVFAFATREGAMGLLQILSADEKAQKFELRYKKLTTRVVPADAELNAVQPSLNAAAGMLPALKGLFGGLHEAIENNDSDTAVVLSKKLIADSKKLAGFLKGTSAEAGVTSGIETLEILHEALANKQMDRAKSMLSVLNQMGPGLEDFMKEQHLEHIQADKLAAENLTAQGWKLWGQRKLPEAEGKFKEAIAKNPEAEGAFQGLGWAQLNQGKKSNAKVSFKKCIELNPKNSAALNGLGWIAHGQDNKDEAISWWEKAIEAQAGATAALNGLTQVYMERKEYDKAIKYYEMWLKAEPNNKQVKMKLQEAQMLAGGDTGAAKEFQDSMIKKLLKEMHEPTGGDRFAALNELIRIGEPAVEELIAEMKRSNNWQVPKALGAIKDKRAVGPLIRKLKKSNFSPMREIVIEALELITGHSTSDWQQWWRKNGKSYTPEGL